MAQSLINLIQNGLDGSYKRQQVISNNIANVNTPDYKRKNVDFLKTLKSHYRNETINSNNDQTIIETTDQKHIPANNSKDISFKAEIHNQTKFRNDGNNVDIDVEMAELAKNNIYYNTLVKQLNSKFSMLKNVINKGGK